MKRIKKIISVISACSIVFMSSACALDKDISEATETPSQSTVTLGETQQEQKISDNIHINQTGYKSSEPKIAVISGQHVSFKAVEAKTGEVVLTKELSGKTSDESSGDTVCYADFSEITKEGTYYISIPEMGRSYDFQIGGGSLYKDVGNGLLKALYYQRCGTALENKYAGEYSHGICHKSQAKLYEDQTKEMDVSGGWHDASDYGKYVVPAAVTAADLMLAFEFYPGGFSDSGNIPESGNGIPDVLDEVKYGVEWMLKMQDKITGGVYHNVTTRVFPDVSTMPDVDVDIQLVMPISTTATADFAAVTAMAARVFEGFDADFSQRCLNSSKKAWDWLESNSGFIGFKNPQDVISGEYSDSSGSDERVWAAAELFRTTGEEKYNSYFVKNFETNGLGLGWQNVSGFAAIAYMFSDSENVDMKKSDEIRSSWIGKADMFVSTAEKDGYRVAMHKIEYNWGSNMNIANHSIHLLIADKLSNNEKYKEVAENSVHYLLGRNSLNQCFITGYGSKQVMNPYHRPSVGDGIEKPVPGFVVGGPDSALEDDVAKENLTGNAPAKCYIDNIMSYSTNEVSTYWNSSALFLFSFVNSES